MLLFQLLRKEEFFILKSVLLKRMVHCMVTFLNLVTHQALVLEVGHLEPSPLHC
jgi:hypothetical protein